MTITPMWLDVGQGGARFDDATANRVTSLVDRAIARHGARMDAVDRDRLQAFARKFDSLRAELQANAGHTQPVGAFARADSGLAAQRADSARKDAVDATAGLFLARDLEHRYADILREPRPVQNAFRLFPIDTTVPVGARTHTVRRVYGHGEVAVHRKGQSVPTITMSQGEEQFPVRHYATSFAFDIFELATSDFASFPLVAEAIRVARDLVEEFANRATWHGITNAGVYGIFNYPWLAKKGSAVAFDGTASASDVIAELVAIADYPVNTSKATFAPDTMVVSPRVRNYLFGTPRSTTTDTSIGKWFTDNHARIKVIEEAWELQGSGPGGTDGILVYRRDRLGIANVVPQAFTLLPTQRDGFDELTLAYMSHGGVIMRDVGNNLLAWVDAG